MMHRVNLAARRLALGATWPLRIAQAEPKGESPAGAGMWTATCLAWKQT
jgi:hypothetical protein